MPFNAGATVKVKVGQHRGQLAKRIMPEVDVKLLIRAARSRRDAEVAKLGQKGR
jgi:hypothetical protein